MEASITDQPAMDDSEPGSAEPATAPDSSEVTVTDDMAISDADKKKFYQTNAERIFNLT